MRYNSAIVQGHGRGKSLGFPTFNLRIPHQFTVEYGVYSAWVWIGELRYKGALHFGPVPTFNETEASLEIFVLDYVDNKIVDKLQFEVVQFVRDIKRFDTKEALQHQISQDVAQVRSSLMA